MCNVYRHKADLSISIKSSKYNLEFHRIIFLYVKGAPKIKIPHLQIQLMEPARFGSLC